MITREFVKGVFTRRPDLGPSLILVFSLDAPVRQAMATLKYLHDERVLTIEDRDMLVVLAMGVSGSFDHPENRHVRVRISSSEPDESLFMRLAHYLETIKPGSDHDLQSLQSGRQKRRNEAREQIEAEWISDKVRRTVIDWSLRVLVSSVSEDQFHMCKIGVWNGDHEITVVHLDGWSGLMRHRDAWLTDQRATPERMNQTILDDIESYLESTTAT